MSHEADRKTAPAAPLPTPMFHSGILLHLPLTLAQLSSSSFGSLPKWVAFWECWLTRAVNDSSPLPTRPAFWSNVVLLPLQRCPVVRVRSLILEG